MSGAHLSSKLAVILHADVAGSTQLVRENEQLAHQRIRETFQRFSNIIGDHRGQAHEVRGDAILAEFELASDAVSAALELQRAQHQSNAGIDDEIKPEVRVGIALGEVIIADGTITGAGVVLAQRLEQLSQPGGVVIQGAAYETIPERFPFDYSNLGEHAVKGFDDPVRAYGVSLNDSQPIPRPQSVASQRDAAKLPTRRWAGIAAIFLVAVLALAAWLKPWDAQTEPVSIEPSAGETAEKPTIAVLPFINISDNPEQEYFVDGITEDVITDLSRISGLRVLASNTTFKYKGQVIDLKQVASELGVSHILEGSVRRSGTELRITSRLIDAASSENVWANRFDRQLDDIFKVQDDVTRSIVSSLSIRLTSQDQELLAQPATGNFSAYDLFLQGQSMSNQRTRTANLQAQQAYRKAIEQDPGYARAYGALAVTLVRYSNTGFDESPEESRRQALTLALKAVELDQRSQHAYWALGFTYLYLHEFEKAAAAVSTALEVAPSYADGLGLLALINNHLGRARVSIELIERAIRLNPHFSWDYLFNLGWAHYTLGDYEQAVDLLRKALERNGNARPARLLLAASLAALDRIGDAEWEIDEILSQNPATSISVLVEQTPFADEDKLNRYVGHLREAGLPE